MFEELPVDDVVVRLHFAVLVRNVLIPEAVIVVPVVHGLGEGHLSGVSLDIFHLCVGLPVEVSLAALDLGLDLEF